MTLRCIDWGLGDEIEIVRQLIQNWAILMLKRLFSDAESSPPKDYAVIPCGDETAKGGRDIPLLTPSLSSHFPVRQGLYERGHRRSSFLSILG